MYCPLYIKTDYSLLSSLIKVDDLIENLKKKNLTSCAIVDNNLYGTMEIVTKFKKNGLHPIIGLDLGNILLYVENEEGYYNLVKIETLKNFNNLDNSILKKYNQGLICICFNEEDYNIYSDIYEKIFIGVKNFQEEEKYKNYETVFINKTLYLDN